MSRLPNPRIQSAYTTLPPAIARTGCPSGARMNTPLASVPAAPLGAPNLPVSSPRTGSLSWPRSVEKVTCLSPGSGTLSTRMRPMRSISRASRASSLRELRRLGAQALALRLERGERAVGVGDRALGIAQRIARLALFAFPALQFLLQRIDAGTKRLQIFLPRRALRRERGKREREKVRPPQALTLPCADTAAMRFATSSASPR